MTNSKQTEIGLIPEESVVVMLGKGLSKLLRIGPYYKKEASVLGENEEKMNM
jgi:hypothetical protein